MTEAPPNLVRYERLLLRAVGPTRPLVAPRPLRVGLVAALEVYGSLPFWRTLLASCGFSVTVSGGSGDVGCDYTPAAAPSLLPVPAESLCEPARAAHRHGASLLEGGADAVVMPWFERGNHCPVSTGYGPVLQDVWQRSEQRAPVPFLTPQLSVPRVAALAKRASDREAVGALLQDLCALAAGRAASGVVASLSSAEVDEALAAAVAAQEQFIALMEQETSAVLRWLVADSSRRAVLFAGRPYHNDAVLGCDFDRVAQEAGLAVLAMSGLGPHLGAEADARRRDTRDAYPWKPAKRFLRAAYFALDHPSVAVAFTHSFGCGYDALSIEEARAVLDGAGRPSTVLSVEGGSGAAAARVRLRTLAAALAREEQRPSATPRDSALRDAAIDASARRDSAPQDSPRRDIGPGVSLRPLSDGVCSVVHQLAEEALVAASADAPTVTLPDVCEACLTEGVPHMVERACGKQPTYRWDQGLLGVSAAAAPTGSAPVAAPAGGEAAGGALIGLLGNPLLVFRSDLNDDIAAMVRAAGFKLAWPDPALLYGEDILYRKQLQRFWDAGVRQVLYLMPFGCLKGSVQVQAALPRLSERYPGLHLTVVEFDPSASSLNRANRIALALAEARASAQPPSSRRSCS